MSEARRLRKGALAVLLTVALAGLCCVGGTIAYFLRYGPGIAKDHDFIAGPFATPGGFTQADLDAATLAARQKQWDLDHQFAVVTLPARPS